MLDPNTVGLPTGARRMELATTPADTNYIYCLAAASNNSFLGLWRSTDGGATWSQRSSSPNLLGWSTSGNDRGDRAGTIWRSQWPTTTEMKCTPEESIFGSLPTEEAVGTSTRIGSEAAADHMFTQTFTACTSSLERPIFLPVRTAGFTVRPTEGRAGSSFKTE